MLVRAQFGQEAVGPWRALREDPAARGNRGRLLARFRRGRRDADGDDGNGRELVKFRYRVIRYYAASLVEAAIPMQVEAGDSRRRCWRPLGMLQEPTKL